MVWIGLVWFWVSSLNHKQKSPNHLKTSPNNKQQVQTTNNHYQSCLDWFFVVWTGLVWFLVSSLNRKKKIQTTQKRIQTTKNQSKPLWYSKKISPNHSTTNPNHCGLVSQILDSLQKLNLWPWTCKSTCTPMGGRAGNHLQTRKHKIN